MSKINPKAEVESKNEKVKDMSKVLIFAVLIFTFLFATSCRYDMQDQPRYKAYKQSDFFSDGKAMRDPVEGTVARGQLRENKAFWTGKKENPDSAAQVQTTTDAKGNTLVSSFPNDLEKIPVPVTEELVNRGQQRFNIYCIVCHGAVGNGDGMVVRRGYPQPPTYHDDRLRNAPDGHFFDVITNGWGKMNSYGSQIPAADRWAIVAYIRALQISQRPENNLTMNSNTGSSSTNSSGTTNTNTPAMPRVNANTGGTNR
ncbi:MAG: cytochrome c [Pyrinomonadaceae bacterium]